MEAGSQMTGPSGLIVLFFLVPRVFKFFHNRKYRKNMFTCLKQNCFWKQFQQYQG